MHLPKLNMKMFHLFCICLSYLTRCQWKIPPMVATDITGKRALGGRSNERCVSSIDMRKASQMANHTMVDLSW